MTVPRGSPTAVRLAATVIDGWIGVARQTLIEEGASELKIDRLAARLGVTRGAFYYRFEDRDHLLRCLIAHWEKDCLFLPSDVPGSSPAQAAEWFDRAIRRLIEEDGFDSRFDLAVRAWARADKRVAWAVEREDRRRLQALESFFAAIGHHGAEAQTRARIFYYHQIGHYAIDPGQSLTERRRDARVYAEMLCGPGLLAAGMSDRAAPPIEKAREAREAL